MLRILSYTIATFALIAHGKAQDSAGLPPEIREKHFSAIKENSPFLRSLNLSDSLILTGIAVVDTKAMATLVDRNTKQSYVVSTTPNAQGWKMVELEGDMDLESVTAIISVDGSTTVKVRYDDMHLKSGEGKPAGGANESGETAAPPERGKGDSRRRGGDPEMREKMMSLSEEQRGKLFQKMMALREKNPEMTREERGELMKKSMDKMLKKN